MGLIHQIRQNHHQLTKKKSQPNGIHDGCVDCFSTTHLLSTHQPVSADFRGNFLRYQTSTYFSKWLNDGVFEKRLFMLETDGYNL